VKLSPNTVIHDVSRNGVHAPYRGTSSSLRGPERIYFIVENILEGYSFIVLTAPVV
jgi:hypothetical protein